MANHRPTDTGSVVAGAIFTLPALVDAVEDYAIFLLSPHGEIRSWNRGAERIMGYEAEEAMGQHFSIFYPAGDLEADKPGLELKTALAEGRIEDEGWRIRKSGERFWANTIITALRDDSGVLCAHRGAIGGDTPDPCQAWPAPRTPARGHPPPRHRRRVSRYAFQARY